MLTINVTEDSEESRMLKRTYGGFIIASIMAILFYFGGIVMNFGLMAISIIAYHELVKAFHIRPEGESYCSLEVIGDGFVVFMYLLLLFKHEPVYFILSIVMVLTAFLVIFVIRFPKYESSKVAEAFFSVIYGPVMLSFIYQIRCLEHGQIFVWLVLCSSWACDIFAYIIGMLFGKRKVFPLLSPKKSLAGCIGGVCGAAFAGALFGLSVFHHIADKGADCIWVFAVISALGSIISQIGDLAASGIKRNHGIKDFGHLIPGHGGIMDRFDSVIVTAPIVYFLAVLFF